MATANQQEPTIINLEDTVAASRVWNAMSDMERVCFYEIAVTEGTQDIIKMMESKYGMSAAEILDWTAKKRNELGMPPRSESVRVELKHGGHAVMRVTETGVDIDVIDRDGNRRLTMQAAENISMAHSGDFAVDDKTVRVPLNSFRHAVTEHELPA